MPGILCISIGCNRQEKIATEYGKTSGLSAGKSVNGVSVLKRLFQAEGNRVKRSSRISPQIRNYDTVIWFPDRNSYPSAAAVQAINDWMDMGYGKTFVYIGRGYDAEMQYWDSVIDQVEGPQHELARRKRAYARVSSALEDYDPYYYWREEETTECSWFEEDYTAEKRAKRLTGPWAEDVVDKDANVQLGTLLESKFENSYYPEYRSLLKCDGESFAFSHDFTSQDGKMIFISNGSFLLNYGLVNQENRKLASNLIDECSYGSVLFLESGPDPITVTESDAPQRTTSGLG